MRCGILWLTACVATAACGQIIHRSLIEDYSADSKAIHDDSVLQRGSDNAHQFNNSTSQQRKLNGKDTEEQTDSSLDSELESEEPKGSEKPAVNTREKRSIGENSKALTKTPDSKAMSDPAPAASGDKTAETNDEVKETSHGLVKGVKWKQTDIYGFIDIPYGKIETGFQAPKTAPSWKPEVHEVKEHSSRCPQYVEDKYEGDLNCLTLSIFVPNDKVEKAGVLFHVHDSSYHSGNPLIYGPEHLVSKGVILVLPNYRTGVLGFLSLQNSTAPGNAGLKDLSLALEWVQNNIEVFGGNPSNIVVSGDGDAGALAGYLALCSPSKPHINKVITESGSMLSHLSLDRAPVATATNLAKKIRDNKSDTTTYYNTFAEATERTIVEAAKGMTFNPCIERGKEPFMSDSPWKLLQNKGINTTFMIGSASYAGTHDAVSVTDSHIEEMNKDFGLFFPEDLLFTTKEAKNEQALKIKRKYFGNGDITMSHVSELAMLSTDASYLSPVLRSARLLVAIGATVFFYEFDYVGELNRELISLGNPVKGAVRSDVIGYLFTEDGKKLDVEKPENDIVRLMVNLWVSFIKTGTPTAENIQWDKMKSGADSEEEFLQISSPSKLMKGVHVDRLRLWTELYDEYFIERSFALSTSPGYGIFITIIFWVTYTKLDYH